MKILIIDSEGGGAISKSWRALLPGVRIRGVEPAGAAGTSCHPHGLQVGYWAACLLNRANGHPPDTAELVFARIFDAQATMLPEALPWMLDVVSRERPDLVVRSWGGLYGEGRWGRMVGQAFWSEWVRDYQALQEDIQFVDFAAAGNSGDWLPDCDVAYPQVLMGDTTNVIGSCRRDGIPSEWSGDGPDVQCLMWADNIYLRANASWELGSGTSFAAPKAAALCAALRCDTDTWRSLVISDATRPVGYEAVRSRKWGFGTMEDAFQALYRTVPDHLHAPAKPARIHNLVSRSRWMEFQALL